MRPRSPAREALARAAEDAALERGGECWHGLGARVGLAAEKAKQIVRDMARAGELVSVGHERLPHARRPAVRYVPRHMQALGALRLHVALSSWATSTDGR